MTITETTTLSLPALADELKKEGFTSIPVIDISDATSPDFEKRKALSEEIRRACLTAGFFYVTNSGVDESVVNAQFEASKAFFATPSEVKKSVSIKPDNFKGFMGLLAENVAPSKNKGDYHAAFNMGIDPDCGPQMGIHDMPDRHGAYGANQWPKEEDWEGAEEFKKTTLAYFKEIFDLGRRIFPLFALALDLPEDFFTSKTRHPGDIMRLLHYPARTKEEIDELQPGIGDHSDYGCFTILRQDSCPHALQVLSPGGWIDATPIPGSFVVNIGDQIMRWTNDVFVSTRHRVLPALEQNRYSMPFFFGCDDEVEMEPIATCVSEERPNRYKVMKAGEYVQMRVNETYKV